MGNKRVSQLVELTSTEVQNDDLFLIIDVSAVESKKITVQSLSEYLNSSGSIISIFAQTAATASYVLGSNVAGSVVSSSFSNKSTYSDGSNFASQSVSSSYSNTSSFALSVASSGNAQTASFLQYSGVNNGTSSFSLSSSVAAISLNTKFLVYTGANNGTASYAVSTGNVSFATNAATASVLAGSGPTAVSASYALLAQEAILGDSASYLVFSPNNGTASYAISAGTVAGIMSDFGIFLATTQSTVIAQLDSVNINPSLQTPQPTYIEAWGTVKVPYTSSIPTEGTLSLVVLDRNTGTKTQLDSTPVSVNISPTPGVWDTYDSGTVRMTFTLVGQSTFSSSVYEVYVTGSPNLIIEPTRTTRFNITSNSDIVTVSTSEPVQFNLDPSASAVLRFTSNAGGPFTDNLTGFNTSGSSNILTLNVDSQSISSIRYVWMLSSLTRLDCSNNPALGSLSGMPSSLTFLSCSSCGISSIHSLSNITSMSYFDCSNNFLHSLPVLPATMSWLNCSNNILSALPSPLPYGLSVLFAQTNSLATVPSSFPDTIVTMSFANNIGLSSFVTNLPISLSYFDCSNSPVTSVPLLPSQSLFMFFQSCSLTITSMYNVTTTLLSNGLQSGSLDISGNGVPDSNTLSNISTLQSRDWTVLYDTM